MEKHNDGIAATGICGCTNASKLKFKVGDKVKVMDKFGEHGYEKEMRKYAGRVCTVCAVTKPFSLAHIFGLGRAYQLAEATTDTLPSGHWWWAEEWLEPAPETSKKLIVTTDGETTTAKLIESKQTIKTATAKCSKDDEFCFETGARIAVDRLLGSKSTEPEKPKFTKADLKDGMFGFNVVHDGRDSKWFVVCNGSFIYETGEFDRVHALDSHMNFLNGYGYVGAVIDGAVSFDDAKSMYTRRKDILFERK